MIPRIGAQRNSISKLSDEATDEPLSSGYNIEPGAAQAVIPQGRDTGAREMVDMRWGFREHHPRSHARRVITAPAPAFTDALVRL